MDIKDRIIDLCIEKKRNNESSIYENVSKIVLNEFGKRLNPEAIRGIVRRFRKSNNLDENFNSINIMENINNCSISPNDLLIEHGFDPSKFILLRSNNSKYGKGSTSSKITVAPINDIILDENKIKNIIENITLDPINTKYNKSNYLTNGKCLVLPIADLHYGMYVNERISNDKYDKDIAKFQYYSIISDIISRIGTKKIEKIYFTIGSDMINCDNKLGTTTKGTPQQNCGFIEDFIEEITSMLVNTIETLRKITNVEVVYIPGNHDSLSSFGIANTLKWLYSKCEDVVVDASNKERKYKVYGNTLMGFAHKLKHANINDVLQMDARDLLGKTGNTVYFLQHYHHEIAIDLYKTDIRCLPTISPLSRWGYESTFGSNKKCQCFILDEKYGITDVIYSFVE